MSGLGDAARPDRRHESSFPGSTGAARPRRLLSVVGARPNFMKIAPLARALQGRVDWQHTIVHTGQHYDSNMSRVFFEDLHIPEPHVHLGVGSGTHAQQTAKVMLAIEPVLLQERPDLLVVVGDVNSTLAASLVASKLGIPVAHVEAGLRSRDWSMPEEINRVLTDRIADLLLTPSRDADENLLQEGIPAERIHFVGNVMIDSLLSVLPQARTTRAWERFDVQPGNYALVTLHRPSNVDADATLAELLRLLQKLATRMPVLFPVHPRTRKSIASFETDVGTLRLVDPLRYVEFVALEAEARLVLTDSGGIQEETTALGVPCLTLRSNTERPITVEQGTNHVVGQEPKAIWAKIEEVLRRPRAHQAPPEKWDGKTAGRIVDVFAQFLGGLAAGRSPG